MTDLVRIGPEEEREPPIWHSYWRALKARRLSLLLGALIGAATAWTTALLRTPVYQASATLEMRAPNEAFLGLDTVSREAVRGGYSARGEVQTAVRLLEARVLSEETREDLLDAGQGIERPIAEAAAALEVRADDDSRILEVRSHASDPVVAAAFVNRLTENFIADQSGRQRDEAEETRAWIDGQLQAFRERLTESEARLQDYVAAHGLLHAAEEDASGWERLRALERELDEAKAGEARLRIVTELDAADAAALPEQDRALEPRRAELAQLKRRLAELDALYKPEHYQVKQVAAQVRSVEESLAQEAGRLRQDARREHIVAARVVQALERQYADAREAMAGDQQKGVEYEILRRETDANRKLYEDFLARAHQADLAAAAPAPLMRIVDPALPPEKPELPSGAPAGLAGLLFGLAVTGAWAVARERLDRTFHRPGELSTRLRLRELGAVPDVSALQLERPGTVAEVALEAKPSRPVEVLIADPEGPQEIAECFRAVRSSLLRDLADPAASGVYVITSPAPRDGKTTVATNLAIAMAELDQPTLLIDADLRRPSLHRNFGLLNRNGLADLLMLSDGVGEALDIAVRPAPETPNLWLLPAGVAMRGGPGLLHTARMRTLLARLRDRYTAVVIDTPPMLAVSDARALARWADRVALVVRAGHTPPEAVLEAVETLTADGAPLMGTVLNSWDPRVRRPYEYARPAA